MRQCRCALGFHQAAGLRFLSMRQMSCLTAVNATEMTSNDSAGLNLSMSNGDFLSSRLTSYQTAISGEETPVAAPESQGPWETPYLQGTSVASSQVCLSLLHACFVHLSPLAAL